MSPESAAELSRQWGFDVPDVPGLSAEQMVEAAADGRLEVLYSSGGNFLDVLPDPGLVADRLARAPVRVHQDIIVTTQMLVDPGEVVVLLPAATRYEQRDGGTETTTERRIAFSPQIRGPRVGEARTEWEILSELAKRVNPDRAHLIDIPSGQAIREEIARVVPMYAGIETLAKTGDQVQWGGPRLCDGWDFPTPDGRAHFAVVEPPERTIPEGHMMMSTRRGKQFNSMVFRDHDPLTGQHRDALFISSEDAARVGVGEGDPILVRSATGEVRARAHIARMRPGNVQMYFPESNPLIAARAAGRQRGARLQRDRRGAPRAMTAWAVFDLNGTLLDPEAIGPDALDEAILAGMTLNHVGEYRPFSELLRAAVARARPPGEVEAAMAAAAAMPAFPEARARPRPARPVGAEPRRPHQQPHRDRRARPARRRVA